MCGDPSAVLRNLGNQGGREAEAHLIRVLRLSLVRWRACCVLPPVYADWCIFATAILMMLLVLNSKGTSVCRLHLVSYHTV